MAHAKNRRDPVFEPIVPLPSDSFVWRNDDYPMPWSVWNQHGECEIHLIRRSAGTCHAGDFIGPFNPGDLYLVGSNVPHDWVTPLGPGEIIKGRDVVLQFDQGRLLDASASFPELRTLGTLLELSRRGLIFVGTTKDVATELLEAIGGSAGLERFVLFLRLLHVLSVSSEFRVLSSAGFAPNLDAEANGVLRDALEHIATNCHEELRLADLADRVGMTESSFSRFFKRMTGNTFTRHMTELRIAKACQLLVHTDKPVTEICHEVGYINISNFNRAFRTVRGMTPSRYRSLTLR
ncbi:AraC family transcriptional regulator [Paracoccus sp. SY]|uniref:helix-turn-helix domain-containing protein n=1 Tax=Paracoccus sp. SY TaxID=1330255 RepID=UPI000CD13B40|nr:AraC family transcriptional regulator [Paracoccus sp. SY]